MIHLLLASAPIFINCLVIFLVVIGTVMVENRVSARFRQNPLKCEIAQWIIFVISRLLIGDLISNLFAVDGIENSTYVRLLSSSLLFREIIDARILQIAVMDALVYFSICFVFWSLLQYIDHMPEPIVSFVDRLVLKRRCRGYFPVFAENKFLDVPRLRLGIEMIQHVHFPLDIVAFIGFWSESRWIRDVFDERFPQLVFKVIEILDFDPVDDSTWPNCSFVHVVATFLCPACDRSNRFYILRSYFYPRRTEVVSSWLLDKKYFFWYGCYLLMIPSCSQSGGLIFIRMVALELLYTFDIRRNEAVQIDLSRFVPTIWLIQYILRDPALWKPEIERRSSIYIRIVYYDGGDTYGHGLIEVPIDKSGRRPSILSSEEIVVPPAPLQFFGRYTQFRGSCNVFGFYVEYLHPPPLIYGIIYDIKNRKFQLITSKEDLLENDRPFQLLKQRRPTSMDRWYPDMPVFFNKMEAIDMNGFDQFWRTRFQPPSLKYFALMAFSSAYHKDVRHFDAQIWTEFSGVNLDDHFPSLSELGVIKL